MLIIYLIQSWPVNCAGLAQPNLTTSVTLSASMMQILFQTWFVFQIAGWRQKSHFTHSYVYCVTVLWLMWRHRCFFFTHSILYVGLHVHVDRTLLIHLSCHVTSWSIDATAAKHWLKKHFLLDYKGQTPHVYLWCVRLLTTTTHTAQHLRVCVACV